MTVRTNVNDGNVHYEVEWKLHRIDEEQFVY
jgi:hypothetical protein